MTANRFDVCLKIILAEEGGNDDDKDDPGGRTSRGITAEVWAAYRTEFKGKPSDVFKAPDRDVTTIYRTQYWEPVCDKLPAGPDLVFFNTSVNSGATQAAKEFQRALGVTADGMVGIITLKTLADCKDIPGLVRKMCDERRRFYHALGTYWKFGKGWLARTGRIQKIALAMVAATPKVTAEIVAEHVAAVTAVPADLIASAKAPVTSADTTIISPETSGATAAGSGAVAGVLAQAQMQLTPFATTIHYVQYALLALAVASIIYMAYGIAKRARIAKAVA